MADPESDPSVSVSADEVRVGKAFEADRFPVPAIAFEIESLAEEPIRIRLVDHIPESFAMEGVGFHPDYDSDNWTAYRDHRVAYERTLDPGESVLTVYGIRIDDPSEAESFLDEPTIELVETDDDPDAGDVLGRETTQVVRDALSRGGEDGLSDLDAGSLLGDEAEADIPDAESEADAGGEADEATDDEADEAPDPRELADDLDSAMRAGDEDVTRIETADESETDEDGTGDEVGGDADAEGADDADDADDAETDADDADDAETDAEGADDAETDADDESVHSSAAAEALDPRDSPVAGEHDTSAPAADSVAAALAAEIREGRVDDDDLSVLREALAAEIETDASASVDARIARLQSEVADLLAYSDALADFLDENGTAEDVLGEVSEDVTELSDRVDTLADEVSAAETERTALGDEVSDLAEDVTAVSDRIEGLDADLGAAVDRLDERRDAVESIETDVEALREEIDDLQTFRDRLSDAFGTGQG